MKASHYVRQQYEKAQLLAAQGSVPAQCLLHLLDLKRAGHSPTRTELAIETSHPKFVPAIDSFRSVYRSSAGYDG